ncbi:hypothetical protein [Dongia sp.]|uniref:hypothetical protein n=1 Tax=Dongia sp. TaxID=1977262 RepID=UPI0035AD9448
MVHEFGGRHNYELNSATVLRDAYRLIGLALADSCIARECQNLDDPLFRLREQFLEDELIHLLIGTAVANRLHDDHMWDLRNDPDELGFLPVVRDCGSLQPDILEEAVIPLGFREACNKVIHAIQITAEPQQMDGAAFDHLPVVLVLRGTQNGRGWQAHLNLLEFIRATSENFDFR